LGQGSGTPGSISNAGSITDPAMEYLFRRSQQTLR
jgi:hypothetical protein